MSFLKVAENMIVVSVMVVPGKTKLASEVWKLRMVKSEDIENGYQIATMDRKGNQNYFTLVGPSNSLTPTELAMVAFAKIVSERGAKING